MSQPEVARDDVSNSIIRRWVGIVGHQLYKYRLPLRDRRFWSTQALVVGIAVVHDVIEGTGYLSHFAMLYFVPVSLFFVPVIYAALNFGFTGSVATAGWIVLITIPNWVFWHQGIERWGAMFQMSILVSVAVFVGQRVDRERSARRQAESVGASLRTSEMKYHGLFKSSPFAIFILSANGTILDANPAACTLFNQIPEDLENMPVANLIGLENEQRLIAPVLPDPHQEVVLTLSRKDASTVYLESARSQVQDSHGNTVIQVLLRDVTQEHYRQAGLMAYAAYVLHAQEEERQRIARELHDDTIQTLALICRQMDSIESANADLPPAVIGELQKARKTTEEVVRGLRDFARALRPPILDDLGIVASVRRLVVDFAERTHIKGEMKVVGEQRRLPQDAEVGIFRIAQEALWNVERHAKASEVFVTLTFAEHEAKLDIKDNGIGFNVPSILEGSTGSQLGLLGMHERATLLGGRLEVQSTVGAGTGITVAIPITESLSNVTSH